MNEKISIQHRGQDVHGEIVHRTVRGIAVEITEPFDGIKTSRHIPYFAYLGDRDPSYLGKKGDRTARELLGTLYDVGRSIDEHRSELKLAYEQYEEEREEYLANIGINHHKKKELRRKLKNGQLTKKQYQQNLERLKEENKAAKNAIHTLYGKHFDEFIDGQANWDDTIDYIEKL